ncbi:plasmolipin [Lingula anatina]|uniref:Plasmolipin n=1 Tax=Lingula anatina TaxID=7574 RepID=A0A1S3IW69_LINAN|nr:plasmolipin [Lingula anatina]|eukprot:XP_013402435.1 plasmolipin [Lingula anatina]
MAETSTTQTTTTTTTSSFDISVSFDYLKTVPGIFVIVELVLSLIVLICASLAVIYGGFGWVVFVAVLGLICSILLIVFYILGFVSRISMWLLLEFIYYVVMFLFWIIAFIVAAVLTGQNNQSILYLWYFRTTSYLGAMIAATVFSCFAMIIFGIHCFFAFRAWRGQPLFATVVTSGQTSTSAQKTTTVTSG